MTGDSKSVHFSGNWGVLGVPLATFLGAWPGQVCACPRELQRGHGTHRRTAEGRGRWGCRRTLVGGSGLFPSSLQSLVQGRGALLRLFLVMRSPKARSSNVWLCHTSQKESQRG